MIEQYTSPVAVNNSQEPWLVGEGVVVSGGVAIPSLDFDFITGGLPGTVTFTRGSNATQFDSSGNLVYAPVNLKANSAAILTVNGYSGLNTTLNTVSIATPLTGITTSTLMTLNVGANTGNTADGFNFGFTSLNNNTQYTQSIFVKAAGSNTFRLRNNSLGGTADFILVGNGTAPGLVAGLQGASIFPVGDGWYRCVWTFTTGTTAPGNRMDYWSLKTDVADGVNGLYFTGAQLNPTPMLGGVTASLSTYYPTTTTAYYGPRFDYNPTTLAARGLLIEEQRQNLLPRSEEFSDASWTKSGSTVTADSTTAPSGTATADTLTEDTSTGQHRVFRSVSGTTNTNPYTYSFFAKASTRTRVYVGIAEGTTFVRQGNAIFDLSAGTVVNASSGTGGATGGSATIQNVGNGWYRCTYTLTLGGTDTTIFGDINLVSTGTTINYTGNGTGAIFLWGAQLEAGAFPTSYIPTTTTALTRSADVASVNTLSPWFNSASGTLFAEYQPGVTAQTLGGVSFSDGTNNNRMIIRAMNTSSETRFIGSNGGVLQWNDGFLTATATATKSAFAYATNDIASTRNGATPVADTLATIPTVDRLVLGADADQTAKLNGYLRRIVYYPRRLSNAELQSITS